MVGPVGALSWARSMAPCPRPKATSSAASLSRFQNKEDEGIFSGKRGSMAGFTRLESFHRGGLPLGAGGGWSGCGDAGGADIPDVPFGGGGT